MRVRSFPKFAELRVWWIDIEEKSEWTTFEKGMKHEVPLIKSLGHYLGTTRQKGVPILKISGTISSDGGVGLIQIPWGTVYNIEVISSKVGF